MGLVFMYVRALVRPLQRTVFSSKDITPVGTATAAAFFQKIFYDYSGVPQWVLYRHVMIMLRVELHPSANVLEHVAAHHTREILIPK